MPLEEKKDWKESIKLAARWLVARSMWRENQIPAEQNPYGFNLPGFNGALREYNAREKKWILFGPVWHTGQGIKALVTAYRLLKEEWLLDGAKKMGAFIMGARLDPDDKDYKMILAPEGGFPDGPTRWTVTAGILEAVDGLIALGNQTGKEEYWNTTLDALNWIKEKLFIPDEGLFYDRYDPYKKEISRHPALTARNSPLPGKPNIDDGVYLKAFHKTGDKSFRDVFYKTAERLLKDEEPSGNFIIYPPSNSRTGMNHPRTAAWWGIPLLMAWKDSGDRRFLDCARRAAEWYVKAQRLDGGLFRFTRSDFKTESFGHATSGILAASVLWHNLIVEGEGDEFMKPLKLALSFAENMQFTHTSDPDLEGAILEKVLPPDGSDRLPYMVRDLASIFYIQASCAALASGLLDIES